MRVSHSLLHAAFAALAVSIAGVSFARVIVLQATGTAARTYRAGQSLPDNATIRLVDGDELIILGRGGTRVFRNGGTYHPNDPVRPTTRAQPRANNARLAGFALSHIERGRYEGQSVVVVRSSGPSSRIYRAGRAIPATDIELRAGDTVVVVGAQGTRTLRGPGRFNAESRAAGSSALATLLRRGRIGAIRNTGIGVAGPPSLWHVDVAGGGGTFCTPATERPNLWRRDSSAVTVVTISHGNVSKSIEWPAGRAVLPWPEDVPVETGDYQIAYNNGSATLRLKRIDQMPTDVAAAARTLIENDCQAQLDLLVDAMPGEASASPQTGPAPGSQVVDLADLLHLDTGRPGTYCVPERGDFWLRREDADAATPVSIAVNGATRTLEWPAGQSMLRWPDLAFRSGDMIIVRLGNAQPVEWRLFKTFTATPDRDWTIPIDQVMQLVENMARDGCQHQLEAFVGETAQLAE